MSNSEKIADSIYDIINNIGKDTVRARLASSNTHKMLGDILEQSLLLGENNPAVHAKIATVLLHFSLTSASIPSQRKTEYADAYIDVAIPGLRNLESNPAKTLLLCIPHQRDVTIDEQIRSLCAIQPIRDNIWLITDTPNTQYRTYSMNGNFNHILDDIIKFTNLHKISRMGMQAF